ncbi:dioxygenase family protein [Runella salmonicolor]|uniref:Catechol 1,2-dioxygenase n=1 Tax=Runella salmonicolor TaxID=2950278 RepID=A0ABT1FLG9_9BACT|nr:catechol 1,2-dioxygenase [Runella salmonicolor]MCP1381643.1 catechol 1,2-dioxygenase [Runella salmonicolor]
MKRRIFLKTSALSAVAVSATGFVRLEGDRYVGDCETTSDVLGPFYRPDSPVRSSLVIKGEKGAPIELFGKIKHDDCITPYKNAKIELWHCNGNGVYDNESADFKYRGTLYSDNEGNYSFKTILPVPYGEGDNYRPAHFHLMISAEGYQPLVTQLYFTGDPWLEKDSGSASPTAKRRILEVQNLKDGSKKVSFDVSMAKKLAAEPAALDRLIGIYVNEKDANKKTELIKKDKQLWIKGDKANGMPFGMNLEYITNNTFTISGVPPKYQLSFVFEVMPSGAVKMMENFTNEKGEKETTVSVKGK